MTKEERRRNRIDFWVAFGEAGLVTAVTLLVSTFMAYLVWRFLLG